MTVYTAFRCPKDLLRAIKAKAKNQRRSLSNYIVCVLEESEKEVKKDSKEN